MDPRALWLMGWALIWSLPVPAGDIYRWTDEDGQVVFSETAPPGVDAERISMRRAPGKPQEAPPAEPSAADKNTAPESAPEKSPGQKLDEDPVLRAANCQKAKIVLNQLETRPRLKVLDASGEPYFITDKEREQRKEAARKSVEAWCD